MNVAEDVQGQIIQAATERFRHYGYGKTTMAEIARDCGMSAGNLYRYFESKSDIGAVVCVAWFGELQLATRTAAERAGLAPAERLEAFVLAMCRFTLESVRNTPHIQEMVDFLCEERLDLLEAHLIALRDIVADILADGTRRGVFAVADPRETACTFLDACVRFEYPPLMVYDDQEKVEIAARNVVGLIVQGLIPRSGGSA